MIYQAARWRRKPEGGDAEGGGAGIAMVNGAANRDRGVNPFIVDDSDMVRDADDDDDRRSVERIALLEHQNLNELYPK